MKNISCVTGRLFDVDCDCRPDVLAGSGNFSPWWSVEPGKGGVQPKWTRHDLPKEASGLGRGFGDINSDGRADIIESKSWIEAPIDRRGGTWTWRPEVDLGATSFPVIVADVDGDGDADLVWSLGQDYGKFWLEQVKEHGKRVEKTPHRRLVFRGP